MLEEKGILGEFKYRLAQVANHTLTSKVLADWSDEQHWLLMEGTGKEDETLEAIFLREVLYDVAAQWESLVANLHSTAAEFPHELIKDWLSQVQRFVESAYSLDDTPRTEAG
jgi:hypothetical protein